MSSFFFYKNVLHLATIYIYIYIYFLNAFITIKKYIFLLDLPQWFYHGFYGRKAARIMVTQPDGAAQRYNVVLQRPCQSAAKWTNSLKISAIFFIYFLMAFSM